MKSRKATVKHAFTASLPVMAGYLVLGMGFGILLHTAGYGWWWALLMSALIYAGSMQYVAIDLLAAGASLITAALVTVTVNVRHIFYGLSMLSQYKDIGKRKPYLIFALTDETFSLVCSPTLPENVNKRGYYLWVSLFNHLYWVAGSTVGGILGSFLPFSTEGIAFAMTALFVVIFVEQWEKEKRHLPALTGLVISVACLLLFGSDKFLIPAMVAITVALCIEKRWEVTDGE